MSHLQLALKLEVERVNLLYRINSAEGFVLLLYAGAYVYFCASVMSLFLLAGWVVLVVVTSALRLFASWRWQKSKNLISTLAQAKRWHSFILLPLGLSGIAWGVAGWMSQYSQNATQQIFTAMTLTFMAAGALVYGAVSIRAMLVVVLPSVLPWALVFFLADNSDSTVMGVLALIYLVFGVFVAAVVNRFFIKFLAASA